MTKAIADYDQAIGLDPRDAMTYYGRGYAWLVTHEYEDAPSPTSAEARPPHRQIRRGIHLPGGGFKQKKEYDNAIDDYMEAIRLKPARCVGLSDRGIAWRNKKDRQGHRRLRRGHPASSPNRSSLQPTWPPFGPYLGDYDKRFLITVKPFASIPSDAAAYANSAPCSERRLRRQAPRLQHGL